VQDGTLLGDVDLVALKHRVDARAQAGLLGELQQQRQGLIRDPVLRVVEEDANGLRRQALAAPRVVGEEPSEMQLADLLVMRHEGLSTPAAR